MTGCVITNRWTGSAVFEAEIDAPEGASPSVKLGLAVKAAVSARANLADAYLADADLADACLADADLARACLAGTNLARASLARAYLADADLSDAYLADADLSDAYLAGTNLAGATGNMREVRTAQFDAWPLAWTTSAEAEVVLQVGCQRHPIEMWEKSDPRWIAAMDPHATAWWAKYRDLVLGLVKAAPATPYGKQKPKADAA